MYLLFLDESGTPDKSATDNIFVLGGIIIHDTFWDELNAEFLKIKTTFGLSEDNEIKWRDIRQFHLHKGILQNLSPNEFDKLINRIYGFPTKVRIKGKLKIVACVVNKNLYFTNNASHTGSEVYQGALFEVLKRFQITLYDKMENNARGIVLIDERDYKQNKRLQAYIKTIKTAQHSDLSMLIENPLLSPSDYSIGIQVADLYLGPVHRNFSTCGRDRILYDKIRENFKLKVGDDKMHGFQLWPYSHSLDQYK